MPIKRDIELLYEVGCMRFIVRQWRQFLNADFQNNTEHSFRVMWLALVIAKMEKVKSIDKILQMALIHDISESRSGDLHYVSRQYSSRNEKMAITDVMKGTSLEGELVDLWDEYEKRETIEAQIVKDADNLDVDLELQEQKSKGYDLMNYWIKMRKQVYTKLYTTSAKKIWKEIQASNPHAWHINARNRFTEGDWKK